MPGFLLSATSTIKCAHGGTAQPALTFAKVLVDGQPVVLAPTPYQVAGCSMPPPPGGNGPCAVGQFSSAAMRVLAGGAPVLLQDSQGQCLPTGTPLVVVSTQTKVKGA